MFRPRAVVVLALSVLAAAAATPSALAAGAAAPSALAVDAALDHRVAAALGERDWLLPSEVAPGAGRVRRLAAAAEDGPPCPTCGERVTYSLFSQAAEHELTRFVGAHTEILVPDHFLARFDTDQLLGLLDSADRAYEVLGRLVGRVPSGDGEGKLPIAFVPATSCGPSAVGCGFIGHEGVEIWDGVDEEGELADDYVDIFESPAEASYPQHILLHELVHNFDVYSSYLHYHADSGHFWTDLIVGSAYVFGLFEGDVRLGTGSLDSMQWFERQDELVDSLFGAYLGEPGGSWATCVRDDACDTVLPRQARAGLALAILGQAGPDALRRAGQFLADHVAEHPAPGSAEAKEELWLEALAAGVGADVSACAAGAGWHNPPGLAARLGQHGPPAAFCADGDGDGSAAYLGDCAGADPAVGPGRPEVPNGVDDDCNGAVDEAVVAVGSPSRNFDKPTRLPAPPVAAAVDIAEGFSYLGFRPQAGRLGVRLCSPPGGFQGFFFAWERSSGTGGGNLVFRGGCASRRMTAAGTSDWGLELDVTTDFGDLPGAAEVVLFPAPPWPAPWGSVGVLPLPGGGFELSATIADPSAFRQPADRVRFGVSGFGEVGQGLLAGGATGAVEWHAATERGRHYVYAQPYAGELPAGPPLRLAFDPAALAPCQAGPDTACLLGGRFEVRGTMRDFESPPNTIPVRVMQFPGGRAESEQAAFFESFNPGNFEIGVKMVDACALPEGHPNRFFWLFVGGLTSADSLVRVEDTASGEVVEWTNPPNTLPTTTADTAAFACGGTPAPGACVPGDEAACLLGRFRVSGTMKDFASPPNAHPLRVMDLPGGRAETDQAAFFESFNPGNFEVGVKMVDACSLPPGDPSRFYWLFAGGLTSARTDLAIRQVATGQVVDWVNPAGTLPTSTADTKAFPCP